MELPELPHFPSGTLRHNASVPKMSQKIMCKILVLDEHPWVLVGNLFIVLHLPWPGAARHMPHLGYLTN